MNANGIGLLSATIVNGQQTSSEIDLSSGRSVVGIITPGTLTSTAITFTVGTVSGGTFVALRAIGGATAYSITVAASQYIPLPPADFVGVRYLKLVGGSAEGGDRVITVVTREV